MTTTTAANNNSSSNSNGQAPTIRPPLVLWAQRADKLFLTIELEDCLKPTIKLEADRLYFKGKSDSIQQDADKSEHEVTIEFYKPINVDDSKQAVRARGTEFVINKQEAAWWPRLLKDSTKQHWLKVDFPKWKDEDDSEDENAGGPMGMGGMGGMGGRPDFSDLMQQFGGMSGGAGDMGAFGAGPDGEDEEYESDDDDTGNPPGLEGDE